MQSQGMLYLNTRTQDTLKPPISHLFRKTVSIDVQSPVEQNQQFFKDNKLGISFSSPPNSGRENLIPDEEVQSQFLPDDTHSFTSHKQVRFSEPQDRTTNQYKYRRQRSIPIPEKVQEDLIGESSQLSPYNKSQIRIKEKNHMNQSTNLLNENEHQINLNTISLQNSFCCKTISSYEQLDQTTQLAEELVSIVKNYLNDINHIEKHFTFEDQEDETRNRFNLQQKVLKKALDHLNFKLNVTMCSPISRISTQSPHFEDLNLNAKELQSKLEDLTESYDLLKDRLEITELKLLEQYEQIRSLNIKIAELEIQNKSYQQELEEKQKELTKQTELYDQIQKELQKSNKKNQQQQQSSQQLQYPKKPIKPPTNNRRHTSSFHEIYSPPNQILLVNSSTNSSQQSPKNLQLSNSKQVDDTTYFGSIQNERRQGYGNLKKGDKKLYMGFWKDDNFNGFGHLNNETIEYGAIDIRNLDSVENKWTSYQGEFMDGQFHGYGIWTFCDNSRFHGVFQFGKACGRGTYYTNISTTTGIWNKNMKI